MIGYCGILLALAAATAADEGRVQALPAAAASAADEAGDAYRQRTRSAIRDVLARPEFADLHAEPYAFWRTIRNWLEGLFQRLGNVLRGMPEWLYWILLVWMLLALLAILAHLIYTLFMLLRGTSSPLGSNPKGSRIAGELLGIKDLDFDTVHAEARRLLAEGDWPAATRYFYVAAILWLDRQGWIVFKRSKTNRDYIDELASRARIQGPFRHLTADFEPIVYGGSVPTGSTIHGIATTVEGLLHEPAAASPG
jgi:hypothetical protein